jgi:uncharacterized membrane protein YGL010W
VTLAIAVVVLLSMLHVHSLRVGSRVQNLLTLFKIALIVGFIGAGMFSRAAPPTISTEAFPSVSCWTESLPWP